MEPYEPFRVHWFGDPWSPVCDDPRYRIEVPVGKDCLLCEELIEADQIGVRYSSGQFAHAECNLRSATGNVTHLEGRCTYTGECNELETGSYRQQALAVWAWFRMGEKD